MFQRPTGNKLWEDEGGQVDEKGWKAVPVCTLELRAGYLILMINGFGNLIFAAGLLLIST